MSQYKGFDELYSSICDKLRDTNLASQLIEKITTLSSDYDRIQHILKLDPDLISSFLKNISDCFENKDVKKANDLLVSACSQNSVELINQALRLCYDDKHNVSFKSVQNITDPENLQTFIETQLFSPPNQQEMRRNLISEIFARRSAILFQKGNFPSCIRDTYRSLKFGMHYCKNYDAVLRLSLSYKHLGHYNEAKLVAQHALEILRQSSLDNEAKSKEAMRLVSIMKEIQHENKQESGTIKGSSASSKEKVGKVGKISESSSFPSKLPELFEGCHEIISGTSSAVELKFSEDRGRHIVALKTIPPGSILIVEKPYCWSVAVKKYPFVCQFCAKPEIASLDGIPCPTCSSVMFCNEECLEKSSLFHRYECRILKLLNSSEKLGTMAVLCFRTIAQTPLEVLLDHFHSSQSDSADCQLSLLLGLNKEKKLDSSSYTSVFAQTTNSKGRSGADLVKRTYAAIYLTLCLRHVGYFNAGESTSSKTSPSSDGIFSENESIIASLMLRHLQSVSCNAYGINLVSNPNCSRSKGLEIEEVGGATYPIISTTNHSCTPNAYRFNIGKFCVVTTLQEISKGMEVFDSYGPLFTISPLKQRQQELENQYLFRCGCEPCLNDWPVFDVLSNPEYKNAYKCPNCEIGCLEQLPSKDKRKCPKCSKIVEFKKIQKLLKTAEEKYARAKALVLKQKFEESENILKSICNYILTIQKVKVLPCKETVEAQEVLKLYWNLSVRNGIFNVE